eukprot:scaffold83_cov390-Pavlova_lutheri.AAC.3
MAEESSGDAQVPNRIVLAEITKRGRSNYNRPGNTFLSYDRDCALGRYLPSQVFMRSKPNPLRCKYKTARDWLTGVCFRMEHLGNTALMKGKEIYIECGTTTGYIKQWPPPMNKARKAPHGTIFTGQNHWATHQVRDMITLRNTSITSFRDHNQFPRSRMEARSPQSKRTSCIENRGLWSRQTEGGQPTPSQSTTVRVGPEGLHGVEQVTPHSRPGASEMDDFLTLPTTSVPRSALSTTCGGPRACPTTRRPTSLGNKRRVGKRRTSSENEKTLIRDRWTAPFSVNTLSSKARV